MSITNQIPIISGHMLDLNDFRLFSLMDEEHITEFAHHGLHRHDCFEMFWITKGQGRVRIDFQDYNLSPNTLVLISPGQIHGWFGEYSVQEVEGFMLIFSSELMSRQTSALAGWSPTTLFEMMGSNPFQRLSEDQAYIFNELFGLLSREKARFQKDQTLAVRNYIELLLIEMSRIEDQWEQSHREEAGFKLTRQYLLAVETNFRAITSVSEYASMLYVSSNHLNDSVQKTLGCTAINVLRERQLLEAKRLLSFSSANVDEIASHIGFRDASYFGRWFKKNMGLTPTTFRKLN
ncbi:AraC family transcriptional regulator [Paenibacillus sp. MER 99-2]|uniref:helix-turn-helix domain-containing protein n=1 Tax=Paenibacillus sp. MER 99-2 TaxID=2939572 RepID=UPI00203ABDB8|nr:AraC family transcriptional regulator [Paenibacillus sp. MER 99-2]MCM3172329.1 AraC family transcriptional regulator [Paenibacillus sp. MER 99-2]